MQIAHSYADDGRPVTESFTIEGRTYDYARGYDSAKRTTSHTFADGNQLQWVYDARNMVTEVQYVKPVSRNWAIHSSPTQPDSSSAVSKSSLLSQKTGSN